MCVEALQRHEHFLKQTWPVLCQLKIFREVLALYYGVAGSGAGVSAPNESETTVFRLNDQLEKFLCRVGSLSKDEVAANREAAISEQERRAEGEGFARDENKSSSSFSDAIAERTETPTGDATTTWSAPSSKEGRSSCPGEGLVGFGWFCSG